MPPKTKKIGKKFTGPQAVAAAKACEGSSVTLGRDTYMIGSFLGNGAYGSIHLAGIGSKSTEKTAFVAKIELMQHSSCKNEVLTYKKALLHDSSHILAKHSTDWQTRNKLKRIGLGSMVATQENVQIGSNYFRVIIIRRFGQSLEQLLNVSKAQTEKFDATVALRIGRQILDSLQFLHSRGLAHGDIKLANICYGRYSNVGALSQKDELFLIDFGITQPFSFKPMDIESTHVQYDTTATAPHQGTLVFSSPDSHTGAVLSRRSDLHVLGFVMLNLIGTLPWMKLSETISATNFKTSVPKIASMKCAYFQGQGGVGMANAAAKTSAKKLVKDCGVVCPPLADFLSAVFALSYTARPDYDALRALLAKGITGKEKMSFESLVDSSAPKAKATPTAKKHARRTVEVVEESDEESDSDVEIVDVAPKVGRGKAASAKRGTSQPKKTATGTSQPKRTAPAKRVEAPPSNDRRKRSRTSPTHSTVDGEPQFEDAYAKQLYERAQRYRTRVAINYEL